MRVASMGRIVCAVLGASVLWGGSFSVGDTGTSTAAEKVAFEKACFRVRDVRSLSAVDDRFVYVRCIRGRHYLLTMENACLGLENSIAMAISHRFNRVCSNDRAWITYQEFNQTRRCGILEVEEVPDRKAALELIEQKRAGWQESNGQNENAEPESSGRR